jgi:hypothetical protein
MRTGSASALMNAAALPSLTSTRPMRTCLRMRWCATARRRWSCERRQEKRTPITVTMEGRSIRPWKGEGLPIDVLGVGGFVVAPPTRITKGSYEFIQGSLDDVNRLPAMRGLKSDIYVKVKSLSIAPDQSETTEFQADIIAEGSRNATLWRFCMTHASTHRIETGKTIDRTELIGAARKFNADCVPPLSDSEVIEVASSAWGYEARGSNWFGTGRRVVASHDEVDQLSPDAFYLLAVLRRRHWGRQFAVANAMAESLGWGLGRFRKARAELERKGKIRLVRKPNQWQGAALYDWPGAAVGRRREISRDVVLFLIRGRF